MAIKWSFMIVYPIPESSINEITGVVFVKIDIHLGAKDSPKNELVIISAFSKEAADKNKKAAAKLELVNSHWPKEYKEAFSKLQSHTRFFGKKGEQYKFPLASGAVVLALGLGDKAKLEYEHLRKEAAKVFKAVKDHHDHPAIMFDSFIIKNKAEESLEALLEGFYLVDYKFELYLSKKSESSFKGFEFISEKPKSSQKNGKIFMQECFTLVNPLILPEISSMNHQMCFTQKRWPRESLMMLKN
jgi:leucyl aminopeptidase